MGMRRRNSRLITVNGVVYRWKVTEDRDDRLAWFVSIEQAELPGQRLLVRFKRPIEWHQREMGGQSGQLLPAAITPNVVRRLIEAAFDRGWQPTGKGISALRLNGDEIIPELPTMS